MFSARSAPMLVPDLDCRALREIGRGGMGVVYEVSDRTGRRLALKVSLPFLPQQHLIRFHQEAAIGRRLMHPGVVRIHGFGCFSGGAWLTMDYAEGAKLEQRMSDPSFTARDRIGLL